MRLSLFFLLWICGLPGFADSYLMYPPGETRAAHIWDGPEPIPGESCPADWKVVKWTPENGDVEPRNYLFDGNKTLIHEPPDPPPVPKPGPNPNSFEQSIRDGIVSGAINANATNFVGQLAKELNDTTRKALWTKIKNAGLLWLDAGNISAIETAASNAKMPLK